MWASSILLITSYVLTACAAPSGFQCSRYCKEGNQKLGYEVGSSYIYNYSGIVKSTINSVTSDGSKVARTELVFKSTVRITAISPCDYVMQLFDINSEEIYIDKETITTGTPRKNAELNNELTKHPLYFSYGNGRIETVCPNENDYEVLHIKKAILSAFQNSMPSLKEDAVVFETDISGSCETSYRVQSAGLHLVIQKNKNLEACSHRKTRRLSWLPVPYRSATKSPLLSKWEYPNDAAQSKTQQSKKECWCSF